MISTRISDIIYGVKSVQRIADEHLHAKRCTLSFTQNVILYLRVEKVIICRVIEAFT